MIIVYVLFLIWLAVSFVSLVPVMFFYIQRRGVCEARLYPPVDDQDPLCIELKQWGKQNAKYLYKTKAFLMALETTWYAKRHHQIYSG